MNDMRKLMEAIRRINEGAETAHYFEHYPHYMGTRNSKFSVRIQQIDEVHDLYIKQEKNEIEDHEDAWFDEISEFGDNYAFGDVIENWPTIRKALETKGVWSDMWEEGSHAISMDSMRDAAEAVREIEAQVHKDEFESEWGLE